MKTQLMEMPEVKISNERVSARIQFAKWLYNQTMGTNKVPTGRIISVSRCGSEIIKLRGDGQAATDTEVRSWIAFARLYFEKNFQCTIWNIRGQGWRASNQIETAKYYGKSVRKTIAWADRTRQLQTIVERKYIPYAIAEVVGKAEGGIRTLSGMRKRFIEQYGLYQISEQKQLEAEKSNG